MRLARLRRRLVLAKAPRTQRNPDWEINRVRVFVWRLGAFARNESDRHSGLSAAFLRKTIMCCQGKTFKVSTQRAGCGAISLSTCFSVILWTSLIGTLG